MDPGSPSRLDLLAPLGTATPDSVAVHCMDSRYREGFDELLRTALGADPLRVVVPGGSWWLAQASAQGGGRLRRFYLHGRVPAQEFVEAFLHGRGLKTAVLVGHQDCKWYQDMHPRLSDAALLQLQEEHIFRAREELEHWAPEAMTSHGFILLSEGDALAAKRLF